MEGWRAIPAIWSQAGWIARLSGAVSRLSAPGVSRGGEEPSRPAPAARPLEWPRCGMYPGQGELPGTRKAAYLLIFRANALLSAAGNVAIRASSRGCRLPTRAETGCTHQGRLYFIYLFFLIACSGVKTRRSTDSSGWQLPHFTFLTEIGRSGRDLPWCTAGCSLCRVCPAASSAQPGVPGVLSFPGGFHRDKSSCPLGGSAHGHRERAGTSPFSFTEGNLEPPRGHCGGKQRGRQALRHGQEGKAPRTSERAARIHEHPSRPFFLLEAAVRVPDTSAPHSPHPYTHPPGVKRCSAGEGAAGTAGHRRSRASPGIQPRIQPVLPGGAGAAAGQGRAEPRPLPRRHQR